MKVLLLIAAIAASTLALGAQNPVNTGSVSGRVLDPDTLSPLAGVSVGSDRIGFVVTDPQGRYTLRGLQPGRVSFSIPSGYTSNPWPDKVVTVVAGRDISGVDFRYRLEAEIGGHVLDEDGNPVPGVRVITLTREFGPDGEMRYDVAGNVPDRPITDDRGAFVITRGVRAGHSYWLLAYQLRKFGRPISDAPTAALSRKRVLAATFYPSADSISAAEPLVLRSLERKVVNIRMLKRPAYCLEATLMAGSAPAQMTFVLSEEERYAAEFRGLPNGQEGGASGTDGKIRLCDLPPGRYRLAAFTAASTLLRTPEYFSTVSITIVDRDVQNVAVATLPVATVSGEVVWDNPPSDPALQQSIVGIILDPAPTTISQPINVPIPSPFSFEATPGLRYSVRVSNRGDSTSRFYVKDVTVGTSSILRRPYVPGREPLRITIGLDGGVIHASVVDANGQPLHNSAVIVFPANAQAEVELATTMVEGLADEAGVFQTRSLQPGRYIVLATDDLPPYAGNGGPLHIQRSPEALARILRARSRGESVEVGPKATIQVNLTAKPLE